jgi:hypothetical protein
MLFRILVKTFETIESLGSPQPTDEERNPYHESKYKNHPSEAY